jgi:hypothetical protein
MAATAMYMQTSAQFAQQSHQFVATSRVPGNSAVGRLPIFLSKNNEIQVWIDGAWRRTADSRSIVKVSIPFEFAPGRVIAGPVPKGPRTGPEESPDMVIRKQRHLF